MKQIYKKIIFFLLLTYFIFVPRDALAANVKLPININVSGTNPVYYRYDVNISKLDSRNNVVSTEEISMPLRRNGTYTYDFGDFDNVGEYRYSISLANADDERFVFDRRNYIVHIQVLTNGTDIYTNTYLEDPSETAKGIIEIIKKTVKKIQIKIITSLQIMKVVLITAWTVSL